ncbi:MAG: hypothetical protein HC862_00775 [Scytonema sp. RU_4_4]|nr:hypothetical protein [Scytonema sp. RU_4_4]
MIVVALAGRRIDAPNTQKPSFPLANTEKVRRCISELFTKHKVSILVCSAACGADLLALEVAGELGLRRRIVLPFERDRFREISVTDRPGNWGALFDLICSEVEAAGDLVILDTSDQDEAAFLAANQAIIDEAQSLASSTNDHITGENSFEDKILAVIVWDGKPRGQGAADMTAEFMQEGRRQGFPLAEILTL